ncbi:hypothetical protein [Amycolatopsis aidingensis]|uniref:hypothetical protein n=1 Tax=Amycolatopsis aidingensis TaxID=2842453 RepID=UPI001C0D636C|nr:hypothetical protein [Amycolatopsis aidingensis]
MTRSVLRGLLAGAAGTTALNAVTYLDMAVRGRPGSTTPEQTVQRMEELAGASRRSGGDEQAAGNRRSGAGALLGIASGLAAGVLYGVVRTRAPRAPAGLLALGVGMAANAGTVLPMTALGVTDPRQWPASSWAMDLVPHLAYGVATSAAYELFRR